MGCCASSSSRADPVVVEMRRRLSLGFVDEQITTKVADREEDRSLLISLTDQTILDVINTSASAGRRRPSWTVGSETDTQRHRCQSFSQKTIKELAEETDTSINKGDIGYACKKGLKPEAPNQDSFFVIRIGGKTGEDGDIQDAEMSIYGVMDGHGPAGHDVSDFVKNELPKVLVMDPDLRSGDPKAALLRTFEKVQRLLEQATEMGQISAQFSGTTCSIILHLHVQNEIYVAHVGDSRCVLGREVGDLDSNMDTNANKTQKAKASTLTGKSEDIKTGEEGIVAVDLTLDHKPDNAVERERIEKKGGRVVFDGYYNYRVYAKAGRYPGLNMSRALGDLAGYYDAGISATPDIAISTLSTKEHPKAGAPGVDRFLLLCSDGVWEFLSSQECVNLCAKFPASEAQGCAETLAKEAWNRWNTHMMGQVVDDITAIIVYL